MADTFTVKLEGAEELKKQFQYLVKSVHPDQVEPVLMNGARKLAKAIRDKAPRGPTGNLKKAVKAKKLERIGFNPASAIAAVDRKRAPHAGLVEWGHALVRAGKVVGHVPPHPFFRPAVDENHGRILGDITKDLKKMVEGAVK